MTQTQRNKAILKAIQAYTVKNTVSKEAAIAALAREGICYKSGNLRPEFGGKPRKKATVAA